MATSKSKKKIAKKKFVMMRKPIKKDTRPSRNITKMLNESFENYLKELSEREQRVKIKNTCKRCKADAFNDPSSGFERVFFCTKCSHCWRA